jgi:predicted enzyme related to lactoylglutathione lyase
MSIWPSPRCRPYRRDRTVGEGCQEVSWRATWSTSKWQDAPALQRFYGGVFGWSFDTDNDRLRMFDTGEGIGGGIGA